jgi:hypothetical protein
MHLPKIRTIIAATALAGGLGGASAAVAMTNSTAPVVKLEPVSTSRSSNTPGDISGPCDEPEHANDPRCTGPTTTVKVEDNSAPAPAPQPAPAPAARVDDNPKPDDNPKSDDNVKSSDDSVKSNDDANGVEDVSGPCDEAEHANDPRCTGGTTAARDDSSGRGRGGDDTKADDNSGRDRGRGSDD